MAFLLRNLSKCLSRDALLTCYHACFQSHINYALIAWGHSTHSKNVFSVQRKAIRILANIGFRDDCRNHFLALNILTLPSAYILQCLIHMYDHRTDFSQNMDIHKYNTRNRENLSTQFVRLERVKNVYHWGIKFYNCLDKETKGLTRSRFCAKVKKLLITKAYYTLEEALTDKLR